MSDDPDGVSRRSFLTTFVALVIGATTTASNAEALVTCFDYGGVHMAAGMAGSAKKEAQPTHQETLEFIASLVRQLQAMASGIGEHELARHLQQARDEALRSMG